MYSPASLRAHCLVVYVYIVDVSLPPGLNLKVLVIDVGSGEVHKPYQLRAEQSWKVGQLKEEISEVRPLE